THARLVSWFSSTQSNVSVIGISVRADKQTQQEKVYALSNQVIERAQSNLTIPKKDINVHDEFIGSGYSLPTPEMAEAVQLFARKEGILLDPVYTGKAAAGLIDLVRRNALPRDAN